MPGRSGPAYADWLAERGEAFGVGVRIAPLDPFRGYANAIDDQLADAIAVLDAFHVVRLGMKAMQECRRRVQQEQLGHRGRRNDPLYQVHNVLRAGVESCPNARSAASSPDWPPATPTTRSPSPGSATEAARRVHQQ